MSDALTPDQTAQRLRALADALETAPVVAVESWLMLGVPGWGDDTEAQRVADVNALATALGLSAEAVGTHSTWHHEADNGDRAFRVRVKTYIAAPAQRCACGATCTHAAA